MLARKVWTLVLVALLASLLAACGGSGDGDSGDEGAAATTTVEAAADADGDGDGGGDDTGGDAASSPEAIAAEASVPVPAEYALTGAEQAGDEVRVDLSYDGDPDVPGYQAAMEAEGWTIESVTPINSFCIRGRQGARYAEVAYLQTGVVLWTITSAYAASMCPRRSGL